jgi:hypothetical protein
MFGDAVRFYWAMAMFHKEYNNGAAYAYAKEKYNEIGKGNEYISAIEQMREYFVRNSENGKIVIFCAGFYGKKLLNELSMRGIQVSFYSDNDERKWQKEIEGVTCIEPRTIDKKSLVIVANREPEPIIAELKKNGYLHIIKYDDVMEKIEDVRPIYIKD